jgi:hypothetical protein
VMNLVLEVKNYMFGIGLYRGIKGLLHNAEEIKYLIIVV